MTAIPIAATNGAIFRMAFFSVSVAIEPSP